ncbi:MAG: SURF1 family cytochrome oxidase biogenesis protein [Novosphingobium sp.]|uniref:SURF1 family cytochrome oxidase biogenesis protein n=1 Tax=Novosphingobium sp. TaxID=1874826 RepID=UPI003C79E2A1
MRVQRIPIFPTLLVLIAVGAMVRLGFWQLDRLHQKEALLAQYVAAESQPTFKYDGSVNDPKLLFRRVEGNCRLMEGGGMVAGHNASGQTGWAHEANCFAIAPAGPYEEQVRGWKGSEIVVVFGWSREPKKVTWRGGKFTGTVAPGAGKTVRIIADPPLVGLEANAKPDPANVPNNHLSYAVQWFLFALTALVIYALALRKRLAA